MNALSRRVLTQAATFAAATLLLLLLVSHAAQAAVLNLGPVSQAAAQAAAVEGEGTAADPYKLGTEADLALIREHPTADFELTANIAVTSPWTAVKTFSGVLDGAGHTIDGITLAATTEGSEQWTGFFANNTGTIERLGFVNLTSIVSSKAEENKNRAGGIVLLNKGTMREDWTENATIEGGWRGAPIATMNEALVTDCYSVNAKVVAGSEGGGLVAWTSSGGTIRNSYVAGANVNSATNSAIFAGYGYLGTRLANNVVISGSLSNTGSNQGRIMARENGGAPTYSNDLSLESATINGAAITGGTLTNKQGKNASEAELKQQSTYEAIGWNFETVWAWSATLERPVLLATIEAEGGAPPVSVVHQIGSEAELAQLREHPTWDFELTADITMTAPWVPVPIFSGVLNGAGHTITGLEVEGTASKAFIVESTGTIEDIGFEEPKSVHAISNPTVASSYSEPIRMAGVTVYNLGTIDRVYTKGAIVEGGWRGAPITACNEGLVTDSYSINTKVVANYESGALVAWESAVGAVTDSYVAGANVTTVTSNGGIFSGYTWAGTRLRGDVVYSGSLTNPNAERGRIIARENGTPTLSENLASTAATINAAPVTGGTATNRNGKDTTEAELQKEATYTGIGWDFTSAWRWSSLLKRPVLRGLHEAGAPTLAEEEAAEHTKEAEEEREKEEREEKEAKEKAEKEAKEAKEQEEREEAENPVEGEGTAASPYLLNSEYDLELIRKHPTADFELTADITIAKGWNPITTFSGVLDGAGHTIDGMVVEGSVTGSASKGFVGTNTGTIERLGFVDPTAIITAAYAEGNRAAIVAVINSGTLREDFTEGATVEGGWRGAPITANNEALVTDCYTVNSHVKAKWEAGGLDAFNQVVGITRNSYVAGAEVTTVEGKAGVFTGATNQGTKLAGNVVYSGSLTNASTNRGRILGVEEGALPLLVNNLSLNTVTVGGATVSGGADNNRNGRDTTEAELKEEGTYVGIGWDFEKIWSWSPTLGRPVLWAQVAAEGGPSVPTESATFQIAGEADLELLRAHPDANFELTADITMAHPWKPLPAFGGTLNGNGHTITDLEPEGEAVSKAFIVDNTGKIEKLGLLDPKSVIHGAYAEANRVGALTVINAGTIEKVFVKGADVEGGWRNAPIAANNEGTVIDSYTVNSEIVSNYESGALVGWNFVGAVVKDDYVAGATITDATSNSGILAGYGWGTTNGKVPTLYEGDVVYSGALTAPSGAHNGRIDGQEKNGSPTFADNLASTAATINGAAVSGGLATNKNGQDATPAELESEATYTGLGWDFTNAWEWDADQNRPLLRGVAEPAESPPGGGGDTGPIQIGTAAELAKLSEHPEGEFELTADLTLSGKWTPINWFGGKLDGNGHTITGLDIEGESSQAFIIENTGMIEDLGFDEAVSKVTGPFEEPKRAAIVVSINKGTIQRVYTKDVEISGGWRGAPIADNNEGTVTDSYSVDSTVEANWEAGGLVAWTSSIGQITHSYVVDSNVKVLVSSGAILAGYGYTGTKIAGNVVYSGSLIDPNTTNQGRIMARENGTPTYEDNLSLNTATVNGAVVTGGTATNKNGKDTTVAELRQQSTYEGIGWDFSNVWEMSSALHRPVLKGMAEVGTPPAPEAPVITVKKATVTYPVGAHPSEAELIAAAEASTSLGALTLDTSAVNFATAGQYTAEFEAENEGVMATPVALTVKVVTATTITVSHPTVSLPASVTPVTAAQVIAAAGASANNGVSVSADVSAIHSDVPGSYNVTLTATDPNGFAVAPATVTVKVTAAPTTTALVASSASQTYGTSSPVTLVATVAGGDGALGGSVGLFDGANEIAVAPLEGGKATFTLSGTLAAGAHALTARVIPIGSANAGSESPPVVVTVTEVAPPASETKSPESSSADGSSTSNTSTPSTSTTKPKASKPSRDASKTTVKIAKGKRPVLTVKVSGGAGKADGQVKVYVDGQVVKTLTLKNGGAELALSLKRGTHKVKASFAGDSSLKASTSATLKVTVKP